MVTTIKKGTKREKILLALKKDILLLKASTY